MNSAFSTFMMILEVKILLCFKAQFKKSGFSKISVCFFFFNQVLKDFEEIYPKVLKQKPPDKSS